MTKLFTMFAVAIIATTVVSCGPSAEDKAKAEERAKFVADSTQAAIEASLATTVETATADTTAAPGAETAAPAAEAHSGH